MATSAGRNHPGPVLLAWVNRWLGWSRRLACVGGDWGLAEVTRDGYIFEQNAVEREGLRLASGQLNLLTSEACARASLAPGAHAIDVGCGQLGALPVPG
jgi:hypothetical protein